VPETVALSNLSQVEWFQVLTFLLLGVFKVAVKLVSKLLMCRLVVEEQSQLHFLAVQFVLKVFVRVVLLLLVAEQGLEEVITLALCTVLRLEAEHDTRHDGLDTVPL